MYESAAVWTATVLLGCADSRESARVGPDGIDVPPGAGDSHGDDDSPSDEMRFDIGVSFDVGQEHWDEPVTLADAVPRPTRGGTMVRSRDGARMFAADEDRDLLYVLDIDARALELTVALEDGCWPGRVAEDFGGALHLACQNTGSLVMVDPDVGDVVETARPCANPRGIAMDARTGAQVVACAEGLLATVHPDGRVDAIDLGLELRDVIDVGLQVRVSTFHAPSVLTVGSMGEIVNQLEPQAQWDPWTVGVSPRAVRSGAGWAMLHQFFFHDADEGGHAPRGGGWDCGGTPTYAVTAVTDDDIEPLTLVINGLPVAFDVAISPDGALAATVGYTRSGGAVVFEHLPLAKTVVPSCTPDYWAALDQEPVSVAFDAQGMAWVQTREPGGFVIVDPDTREVVDWIDTGGKPILDTGYLLFHRPTDAMAACATCHPEGREDGTRWSLTDDEDRRRTMALDVGLGEGAPFHWPGDMKDIGEIADEVFVNVMGGPVLDTPAREAFERFLFAIPPLNPRRDLDPDAVARGKRRFEDVGCAECHVGARLTNELTVELGWLGKLQVPSLRGVAYRAPYMHDSRAQTLDEAIVDMLAYSDPGGPLTAAEIDDIATFLRAH